MKFIPTALADVYLIEPEIFTDARGHFYESFHQQKFSEALGYPIHFVQDNQSYSKPHVVRGLHYQIQQAQGKLVRVIRGRIRDVAVDIRRNSATFGHSISIELSADNQRQLWIPIGFAHGFSVLSEAGAEVGYKVTDYWAAAHERCILWNDPALAIDWGLAAQITPLISAKDAAGKLFTDLPNADTF